MRWCGVVLAVVLLSQQVCAQRRGRQRQQPKVEKPELDYYGLLGLQPGPETLDSAIKREYRKLSRQLHPDLNPDPAMKEKYTQVQEAYGVLSDRKKRKVYDIMGHEGLRQLDEAAQRGGRRRDPFAALFGGGGSDGPQRGPDMEFVIKVSLDDVYNGADHVVPINKQTLKSFDVVRTCMKCKAQPPKIQKVQIGPGMVMQQQVPPDCNRQCGARGQVKNTLVQTEVRIERGVPEEHTLTYELEGDEYPDRLPGDLKFSVWTPPHRTFTRDGNDLHMTVTISLLEALTGFTKKFAHMDGHEFTIERQFPTHHGFEYTLPGEGMPKHETPSETGDLHVRFEVKFPTRLTEAQKKGFKDLLG